MSFTAENIENLVAVLSSIRDNLSLLAEGFIELEKVLDAEEQAIQKSDLNAIEKIVPDKERCGDTITKLIRQLQQRLEECYRSSLFTRKTSVKKPIELNELVESLKILDDSALKNDTLLASQVLLHLSPKIQRGAQDVITLRKKIQPKIEANSYLVRRLLNHHQETYRFWQNLLSEAESVYSSYGKTKSLKSQSILEVKT